MGVESRVTHEKTFLYAEAVQIQRKLVRKGSFYGNKN